MGLEEFRGEVRTCGCKPNEEMACTFCRGRNYVAKCKACDGKGQNVVPVAGCSGTMSSTCNICGGTGTLPANKPEEVAEAATA